MYKSKLNNNLTENEIIREIIYKNYDKNIKRPRLETIICNFFNNKGKSCFINKNKLERSIKNINREMEEAQREFSKLFEDNNYEM